MDIRTKISFSAVILICCAVSTISLCVYSTKKDVIANMNITFLDVGQGDATFIELPTGEQILIDCAIDARIIEALSRVMPFYDRSIDMLLITHPDLDHYGGCIDVLQRFDVDRVVYTGLKKDQSFFRSFEQAIHKVIERGARYMKIEHRQVWEFDDVSVEVLFPDTSIEEIDFESNDTSIILLIRYGDASVLLMGDAELPLETYLVDMYGDMLDVDVLKAGHHGSDTSSIQRFVDTVTPDEVIVSAGAENTFGHPSKRVLKRFERAQARVWRTDTQGDIILKLTTSSIHVTTNPTN